LSLWTIFFLNHRDLSQFLLSLSSHPIPSPPSRHSSTPPANEPFTRRDFFPRLNNYKFFCPISNTFNKKSLSLSLSLSVSLSPPRPPPLYTTAPLFATPITPKPYEVHKVLQSFKQETLVSFSLQCLCGVCACLSLSPLKISLSSRCGESPSSQLVTCRDANARGFPAPRRAGNGGPRTDGRTDSQSD
jgi:hypothetical protein